MKTILLTILTLTMSTGLFADTTAKDNRLCKLFQEKATVYKKSMRTDKYAKATLESYNKRAKLFCKK